MRCQHTDCNKKIGLIMQETNKCRCEKIFCNVHRLPVTHKCGFDHKTSGRKDLMKTLIQVIPEKIIKV